MFVSALLLPVTGDVAGATAALELELELESEVSVRAEDGDRVGESMVMWGETGDSDSLFEPSFVFVSEDEPAEGLADDAVVTGVGAPEPEPVGIGRCFFPALVSLGVFSAEGAEAGDPVGERPLFKSSESD